MPRCHHSQMRNYLEQLKQLCECEIPKPPNLSHEFNAKTLAKLLRLRKGKNTQILTQVSDFSSLDVYYQILRENPLIFNHPKFMIYHYGAWWYYRLQKDSKLSHIPSILIAQYARIKPNAIENWLKGATYPRMLFFLAKRGQAITNFQQHITALHQRCSGIKSIAELNHRIHPTHFFFGSILKNDKKFSTYQKDAFRFLGLLQLVEAGYHPSEIEQHFRLQNLTKILYYKRIPYLLRVAAQIPEPNPQKGLVWLPTITNWSKLPDYFIQVPRKITLYKQILPVLKQLLTLKKSGSFIKPKLEEFGPPSHVIRQWVQQFGKLKTFKDKIQAFAYALIGVSLSDGCIAYYPNRAKFSSIYQLTLSRAYDWSLKFGERVTYYLTCLGFPMKEGKGRAPSAERPFGSYIWYSTKSPFLTWVNQAILGFKPRETHTNTPAKIDWLLTAPSFFLKRVIQGLFDGDGWAMPTSHEIGVYSEQNQKIILQLLRKVGIKARKEGRRKVLISSKEAVEKAVKFPVFLASKGRQRRAEFMAEMDKGVRLTGHNPSLPLMRRVLDLHKRGLSINRIRVQVFNETGVTLSKPFISRTIRKGAEVLKVDMVVVRAYFELLHEWCASNKSKLQVVREVRKRTGYQGTMRNWLNSAQVPHAVKLYLSVNPEIDQAILDAFPHLVQYLAKSSKY